MSADISAVGVPALPAAVRAELRTDLEACRQDEVHHRDGATAHGAPAPGWALRWWCGLVGRGSAAAVSVCRHV